MTTRERTSPPRAQRPATGPPLGAHMSIAGGYYKAVEAAAEHGCDCVQLFTKNNNQWRAKPITQEDGRRFRQALRRLGIKAPLAHASYLINLATPQDPLWQRSIEAVVEELHRAEVLGIPYVVLHPGSYTTSSPEAGLERIARALDQIHERTAGLKARVALETTAGQGSNLGWRLEHLAWVLHHVQQPQRVVFCLDTCHLFAAGYPLAPAAEYERTMKQIDRQLGRRRVKAIHLNDSKGELGSRLDRHMNIGYGHIGLEGFRLLLNDSRWQRTPMYLETPKGTDPVTGLPWDVRNLALLRRLVGKRRVPPQVRREFFPDEFPGG